MSLLNRLKKKKIEEETTNVRSARERLRKSSGDIKDGYLLKDFGDYPLTKEEILDELRKDLITLAPIYGKLVVTTLVTIDYDSCIDTLDGKIYIGNQFFDSNYSRQEMSFMLLKELGKILIGAYLVPKFKSPDDIKLLTRIIYQQLLDIIVPRLIFNNKEMFGINKDFHEIYDEQFINDYINPLGEYSYTRKMTIGHITMPVKFDVRAYQLHLEQVIMDKPTEELIGNIEIQTTEIVTGTFRVNLPENVVIKTLNHNRMLKQELARKKKLLELERRLKELKGLLEEDEIEEDKKEELEEEVRRMVEEMERELEEKEETQDPIWNDQEVADSNSNPTETEDTPTEESGKIKGWDEVKGNKEEREWENAEDNSTVEELSQEEIMEKLTSTVENTPPEVYQAWYNKCMEEKIGDPKEQLDLLEEMTQIQQDLIEKIQETPQDIYNEWYNKCMEDGISDLEEQAKLLDEMINSSSEEIADNEVEDILTETYDPPTEDIYDEDLPTTNLPLEEQSSTEDIDDLVNNLTEQFGDNSEAKSNVENGERDITSDYDQSTSGRTYDIDATGMNLEMTIEQLQDEIDNLKDDSDNVIASMAIPPTEDIFENLMTQEEEDLRDMHNDLMDLYEGTEYAGILDKMTPMKEYSDGYTEVTHIWIRKIETLLDSYTVNSATSFNRPNRKYVYRNILLPSKSAPMRKPKIDKVAVYCDISGSMTKRDLDVLKGVLRSSEKRFPRKTKAYGFNSHLRELNYSRGRIREEIYGSSYTAIDAVLDNLDTRLSGRIINIIISDGGFSWQMLEDYMNKNKREIIVVILTSDYNRYKDSIEAPRSRYRIINAEEYATKSREQSSRNTTGKIRGWRT